MKYISSKAYKEKYIKLCVLQRGIKFVENVNVYGYYKKIIRDFYSVRNFFLWQFYFRLPTITLTFFPLFSSSNSSFFSGAFIIYLGFSIYEEKIRKLTSHGHRL